MRSHANKAANDLQLRCQAGSACCQAAFVPVGRLASRRVPNHLMSGKRQRRPPTPYAALQALAHQRQGDIALHKVDASNDRTERLWQARLFRAPTLRRIKVSKNARSGGATPALQGGLPMALHWRDERWRHSNRSDDCRGDLGPAGGVGRGRVSRHRLGADGGRRRPPSRGMAADGRCREGWPPFYRGSWQSAQRVQAAFARLVACAPIPSQRKGGALRLRPQ